MAERTRLCNLILSHWRTHRPKMVSDLESRNQLEEALEASQARVTDTLYSLLTEYQMDYRQAWEEAMYQELLPEE